MPRTPLASSLRTLWRDLTASRRTGIPVDELRELRAAERARRGDRPPGMSRRGLLIGGAAGAALLAAPRRGRAANQDTTVAVVGGGVAGLTCALGLTDHGIDVTVYEASGRLGGRMVSNTTHWDAGQVSEGGGELIDSNHVAIQGLASRFGLPLDDLLAAQPAGSEEVYKVFGSYYPKHQADADFDAIWDVIREDARKANYPTLYNSYTAAGLALDQMSVYDWIESRVPGGHDSPLGQVLDLAYAIEYGADTPDQSALNLLYLLAYQPKPYKKSLAVFGESDERFHVRGGNQQIPLAIASYLGSRVVTGHKLVALRETAGGRYTLTFDNGGNTVETTVDYVALCIPFPVLADVDTSGANFDALKQQAIAELGRGHNGKLQLQFTSRIWNGTGAWPGIGNGSTYADTGYQCSWEVTRGQAGTPGILVLYSGGTVTDGMRTQTYGNESDPKVRQDAQEGLSQIEQVYPGLDWNGKATQSIWHRSPLYKNSYSYWKVGQYTAFSGYEGVRQGGVLFAGEHTSQDFQGFMEGGASEGARAAGDLRTLIQGH